MRGEDQLDIQRIADDERFTPTCVGKTYCDLGIVL